jgi:transposase
MGNPRGVKRDFVALEKRRFQAVKLFSKGLNNSEIGRRLKVSNQTVSRWRKEQQQGGNVALRSAGRAGRLPCLSKADKNAFSRVGPSGSRTSGLRDTVVDV